MSGGIACICPEKTKPMAERQWFVIQRNGNASAFNGYKWQYSAYSCIQCRSCYAIWRTKADYVQQLKDNSVL